MVPPPPDPYQGMPLLPWAQGVTRYLRTIAPRESSDLLPEITPGGGTRYRLRQQRSGSSGAQPSPHPFQVVPAPATSEGGPQALVHVDSWLMGSLRWDHNIAITGLGVAFPLAVDEFIYLKVTVSLAGEATAASIEHGDAWEGYAEPVVLDDPDAVNAHQQFAYCLLAHTMALASPDLYPQRPVLGTGAGSFQIAQCVTTNLRVCRECYGIDRSLVIIPHFAPGPAATP